MSLRKPFLPLLTCHNLSLERGGEPLFQGLSVTITEGGVLLLGGCNGSGRTSLLKVVAGLLPSQGGEVFWRDNKITRAADYRGQAAFIGRANGLKEALSVAENLRFWAELHDTRLALAAVIHYLQLKPVLDRPCRELSADWQRRAALARLMLTPASLWLLDDPACHLDAQGAALLGGLIASHSSKGGVTVLSGDASTGAADWLPRQVPVAVLEIEDFL